MLPSILVSASVLLYLAACCLPASDIGSLDLREGVHETQPTYGIEHLAWGWVDIPSSLPSWGVNFVLWAGMICWLRGRYRIAAALGISAAMLGATTLVSYKLENYYIGFYMWEGSHIAFAAGAIAKLLLIRRSWT
jgi:hypothetical protein